MTDARSEAADAYRKADLRLRLLLFGDGIDTVGQVRGEIQRGQVTAELRRMRGALDAALESRPEQPTESALPVVGLEEDLQSIASFVSQTHQMRTDLVPTLVTPAEAADALRMSVSTIYRAVRNGEIRAVKETGRALRIPSSEVQRIFEVRLSRVHTQERNGQDSLSAGPSSA